MSQLSLQNDANAIFLLSGDQLARPSPKLSSGKSDHVSAVAVHHIQVWRKAASRRERYPSPIRRAGRIIIRSRVVGELEEIVPVYVHGVDVPVAIPVAIVV